MKNTYIFFFFLTSLIPNLACRKAPPFSQGSATLTIANVLVEGQAVKLSSHTQVINNNAFAHVGLPPGATDLYVFPIADSLKPYYISSKALQVKEGEIYTLFLGGLAETPNIILLQEALPQHIDSSMGVRFVNLSPGSPSVNITLSKSPTIQEFTEIEYQQVTKFQSYPITSGFKSYTFQVRETNTSKLITSLTLSGTNLATGLPRFKNVTLVLRGLVGGPPAAGITRINHY
jgi:hypothetical protein